MLCYWIHPDDAEKATSELHDTCTLKIAPAQ